MKKIWFIGILILLLAGIFEVTIWASETEETTAEEEVNKEPDTDITLHVDAVRNKTAAKSALADMHGVFVFRDAFITQEKIVKEIERKNREEIEKKVLTSEQPELEYMGWVDLVLTAKAQKYIKDIYVDKGENNLFLWIYCIVFSICILCVAIWIDDYRRKNKGKGKNTKKLFFILLFLIPVLSGCGNTQLKTVSQIDSGLRKTDYLMEWINEETGSFVLIQKRA